MAYRFSGKNVHLNAEAVQEKLNGRVEAKEGTAEGMQVMDMNEYLEIPITANSTHGEDKVQHKVHVKIREVDLQDEEQDVKN